MRFVRTAAVLAAAVAFGLFAAWVEGAAGIPKNVVQWFWIVLMVGALCFAAWSGWGYYRALRDDDWE